ncbi:cytidine deaminase-like protein [Jimgerdemannia flammicorona]|uniref:Deoxycytidylate deaminase n=1 Tax=Jimgerdemannia flammicorona TaxID=994334 RepID=A0A433QL29_9FUNG|nr:cytidine deaminase-like protein [Jimgerdemannia flammicorona]
MLIGICGSPCSGKHTVVRYLVDTYAFRYLSVHNRNTVDIHRDELTDEQRIDFNDVKEMEQFVTKRWREDFVTCHVGDAIAFEKFRQIYSSSNLESFALHNDHTVFGMPLELHSASSSPSSSPKRLSVHTLTSLADLIILNPYLTLPPLHAHLLSIDLINPERLRPTWDTYFMHLSDLAARRSNCMKRRVGCILVKDLRVIATGYNGTPRGMRNCNEGGCKRCNEAAPCQTAMDKCLCMHAEENALLEAGKEREEVEGHGIVQVGIREVVYSRAYGMDELTVRVFAETGVRLRQHSSPAYGEVQVDLEAQRSMGGVGAAEV